MEYKQQKSLNEDIQRVVLGIIQESSSHSIKDYTLKLKKKKVEKYDDVDIDDDVTIYHYDILLNKKVVGEIREDDRTGDGYGKLHGKNLPGGYGGGGVGAFHAFLRSKLFQKWSKNVKFFKDNPLSGLGESVEEQLDEIFGFFEKRSAAEVAAAAKESEKRKKEYEKRNARVKAVGYDKLADMIGDNMSLIGYPDPSEFYDMKVKWSQLYDDVYTGKKEYDQKETYDVVAPILKKQQAFWNKRKSRFDNNASGIRSVLKQGK